MADPNEKVDDKTKEPVLINFPLDLYGPGNDKSIVFNFYKYEKPDPMKKELKEPLGSIALPIPPQLSQNDSLEYSDFEGGWIARASGSTVDSAKKLYNKFINGDEESIGQDLLSNTGALISQTGMSVAESLLGDEFNYFASQMGGTTLNPHVGSIFNKVGLRSYEFGYVFIARNQKESDIIKDIIYHLKYFSHPSTNGGSSFFYHPEVVTFSFTPQKINKYLFVPNICGITGINVAYNNSTTPTFFEDTGAPVEIVLSIQVKELTYETKESLERYRKIPDGTVEIGEIEEVPE